MPFVIGMDEAGYGPNLGPLVVTAVVWEVPGDPRKIDFWKEFAEIVAPDAAPHRQHLQIADSKVVYTPSRGLAALETGVLAALELWRDGGGVPPTFRELCRLVTSDAFDSTGEPWFDDSDLEIPHTAQGETVGDSASLIEAWRTRCTQRGLRLISIRSEMTSPERFNACTRRHDSKGRALTELSMQLLGRVWREIATRAGGFTPPVRQRLGHDREEIATGEDQSALILADKHGGRNRYQEFLPLAFGDGFIQCRAESMESSRYQIGGAEIRFETKSERHLPVALASMVCKYVRELAMILFNRFWSARLPGLKPTAGYPLDAVRFRGEIAALQREMGIADDVLWRER
ncbi:MAG: hypothetical protein EXS05_03215 [Planctomycetaceae bacterium]|nr:hypothetical protein [Planctomycetaceae bacterium]